MLLVSAAAVLAFGAYSLRFRLEFECRAVPGFAARGHSSSYVIGDIHTNTIGGFFGNLKTGMRGAYKQVSQRWLQSYLDEYAWRYNERFRGDRSMFHNLLKEAAK